MADIRIKDLPLATGPTAPAPTDAVAIDGLSTRKAPLSGLADAIRPIASQAEAEAGSNAVKGMSPLTTAQAIAAQALVPSNIGTSVQGYSDNLTTLAGVASGATGRDILADSTVDDVYTSLTTAVWTSGTTRTMKQRATDTYSILDAPGSPDPTGTNESTSSLMAMMTENAAKYDITRGTFVSSLAINVPAGASIEGQGGGSRFQMRTKIVFIGTATKSSSLANVTSSSFANPNAGDPYLADSGTRGNTYSTLDLTTNFSYAVRLAPGSRIRNLGIYPNLSGGIANYLNGSNFAVSDDWDMGVWADNADYWSIDNCDVAGHWRKSALLVSANGAGPAGSCEKGQATHSRFQGFRGITMRSANPADGNFGFAGTNFLDCDVRPLNHQSAHLATSSMLAVPFASPSACLEMSGGTMRGIKFINTTFIGRDDICMIFGPCSEIQFDDCYSEGQNVRVNGSFLTSGQGSRMVASSQTTSLYMYGNKKFAIDYTPYQAKDVGFTPGRYSTSVGVFNPAYCWDEEFRRPRSTTSDDIRLPANQSFKITDINNAEVARISSSGRLTLSAAGGIEFPNVTTAQLLSITDPINTVGKFLNKQVFNTTTGLNMRANGGSAGATWRDPVNNAANTLTPA